MLRRLPHIRARPRSPVLPSLLRLHRIACLVRPRLCRGALPTPLDRARASPCTAVSDRYKLFAGAQSPCSDHGERGRARPDPRVPNPAPRPCPGRTCSGNPRSGPGSNEDRRDEPSAITTRLSGPAREKRAGTSSDPALARPSEANDRATRPTGRTLRLSHPGCPVMPSYHTNPSGRIGMGREFSGDPAYIVVTQKGAEAHQAGDPGRARLRRRRPVMPNAW